MITSDTTIYADMQKETYCIDYVTNGGTINSGKVDSYTHGDTVNLTQDVTKDGFKIRRVASEQEIVCLTSLDTADALLKVLESISFNILPL